MPTQQRERLTPRQTLFVQAVASGLSHTKAAQQAGYTGAALPQTASALARKPHVAIALARARNLKTASVFTWSIDGWRDELGKALRNCYEAQDLPSRLRALELAGKHLGALEPSAQITPAAAALIEALSQGMAEHRRALAEKASLVVVATLIDTPAPTHARAYAREDARDVVVNESVVANEPPTVSDQAPS